jgi:hypothetical protein
MNNQRNGHGLLAERRRKKIERTFPCSFIGGNITTSRHDILGLYDLVVTMEKREEHSKKNLSIAMRTSLSKGLEANNNCEDRDKNCITKSINLDAITPKAQLYIQIKNSLALVTSRCKEIFNRFNKSYLRNTNTQSKGVEITLRKVLLLSDKDLIKAESSKNQNIYPMGSDK